MINNIISFSQLKKYCLINRLNKPKKTNVTDIFSVEKNGIVHLIKKA